MNKTLHNKKSIFSFLYCAILLPVFILISAQIQAGVWYVNDESTIGDALTSSVGNDTNPGTSAAPFLTITFAIATASAGDTIYVDAGTYNGDVFITKALTLRGVKFGIPAGPAANPVGRGTNETVIGNGGMYYGQSVDNITVDGFTIDLGLGIRGIEARGFNTVVINNIVIGSINPLVQQIGISTRANGPLRLHRYFVRNNNVKGCRNGFLFDGNLEDPSEFTSNYASGCLNSGFQIVASENHIFRSNVSENNAVGLITTRGNLTIEQNTFTNNTVAGIRLVGTQTLSGNLIQFNFFQNNATGIALTDPNPGAVNNEAHFNSFTGNTVNIGNLHTANFNATCNWYGTTDLPTITATIGGSVTFVPILTDGIDANPGLDGFQPNTTCVVPVTLVSFNASVKNYDVQLRWQTSTEVNSSHFIIERSTDNRNFITIGRVEASGFSDTRKQYGFTDSKPVIFDQPVFYRLRMVDLDASYKYSRILSVVLKPQSDFVQQIYPNPVSANAKLNVNYIASGNQDLNISIVNSIGQIIRNYAFPVIKGTNTLTLQMPSTGNVLYYLIFRSGTQVQRIPVKIN